MRIRMKPTTAAKMSIAMGIGMIAIGAYMLFCGIDAYFIIACGPLFLLLGYAGLKKAKK